MPTRVKVVIHKLAIGLVSACLVSLPVPVHALGFGNIRINSALNEPLDAEIDLLSATEADLNDLKVGLASREAFARVGIERPAHLSSIRFSIQRRANGKPYLKLTTKQSVREPFLDFLLEMNWKSGRMLREYTVLLDPPGRMQYQPAVVASPQTVAPETVARQEKKATETPFVEPKPAPKQAEPLAEESIATIPDELLGPPDGAPEEVPPFPEPEPVPLAETVPVEEPVSIAAEKESPALDVSPVVEPEPVPVPEPAAKEVEPESASIAAAEPSEEVAVAPQEVFSDEKFPLIPLTEYQEEVEPVFAEEPVAESTQQQADSKTEEPAFAETEMASESGALEYGKVKKNDKLWKIAEQLKPDDSISIYQVMMALLQSNPDAFIEQNVHRLRVGQVLRIEDRAMLTAMTRKQAAAEYIAQTEAWNDYRQQVVSSKATPAQTEMASDVGTSVEPAGETGQAATESSGELVLTAPEGEVQAGGSGTKAPEVNNEVVILREEIKQALAEAEAEGNKNIAFNARLRSLEEELKQLQRSLTVKDDELAVLQQQLSDINKQAAEAEQQQENEKQQAETAPVVEEKPAEVAVEKAAEEQQQTEAPVAESKQEKVSDEQTTEKEGVFDGVALMLIGVGGALAALLAGIFFMRRRKQTGSMEDSILSNIPDEEALPSEALSLDTNLSGESSFLSDFAVSGASALSGGDTDVDPLTEADVFMAYGRYEAAEERILDAIKKDPERLELRTKLLELYNTTNNTEAFEKTAEEFYEKIERDPKHSLWQKVATMGSVLLPASSLFADAVIEAETEIDQTQVMEDMGMETIALDASDLVSEEMVSSEAETADDEELLGTTDTVVNYHKEESEELADTDNETEVAAQTETVDELDFNLDFNTDDAVEIDLDTEPEAVTGESEELDAINEADLDLSLGIDFSSELSQMQEIDDAVDFNVEIGAEEEIDLEESVETAVEEAAPVSELSVEEELDSIMSDLQLDEKELTEHSELLELGGEESALPDMDELAIDSKDLSAPELDATDVAALEETPLIVDEVGTKLDLAKAYIDMGDPDGARSILDEVLEEGTPPQQQEAQQLMEQI